MILNHRLNGHDIDAPENCSLVDAVDAMTGRASSVVTLLQSKFATNQDCQLSDEIMYEALESVAMELVDIQKTVQQFHLVQCRK